MKAIEQYFPVVLFIMLYRVVLLFESVGEILKCDNSNESYWAELSCGAVYYAVQGGSVLLQSLRMKFWSVTNVKYFPACGAVWVRPYLRVVQARFTNGKNRGSRITDVKISFSRITKMSK